MEERDLADRIIQCVTVIRPVHESSLVTRAIRGILLENLITINVV